VDLNEVVRTDVDLIRFAQDKVYWWDLANVAMNLWEILE
jgi:hypothetical protein